MKGNWMLHKDEKGVATILVAGVMIFFLLGFLVVGIDFARMYYIRGELQNAADAAAIAGSAVLTGATDSSSSDLYQTLARQAAWKFACKNNAAGERVYLVTNSSTDCENPPSSGLNEGNDAGGDIIVGHWNPSSPTSPSGLVCEPAGSGYFCRATGTTGLLINAIKVVPKRTGATPGMGRVDLLFGKVMGWTQMDVSRTAIAVRLPRPSSGFAICNNLCTGAATGSITFPYTLELQANLNKDPLARSGIAWTEFIKSADSPPATNPSRCGDNSCARPTACDGQNLVIASFIWQLRTPPAICDPVDLNSGVGSVPQDLECAFTNPNYDTDDKVITGTTVNSWKVIAPAVGPNSSGGDPCPVGGSGTFPDSGSYPVVNLAELTITSVAGQKVTISAITCSPCGVVTSMGEKATLVR